MRIHDNEYSESLRPKSSRADTRPSSETMRAAATGRSDVLDPTSLLGLQRAVGNAGVGAMLEEERSPVHDVVNSGGGSALAPDVRNEMQGRLGHDFSDVRVHTDSRAADSAASVNAHAYTVGSNIVFQRDKFDPGSSAGKTMLAHELTHVVQQRSGPVDGTETAGGVKVSDPSDRFEREAAANADRVMSSSVPDAHSHDGGGGGESAVQRDAEDGEEFDETAQGTFIQRDEEDGELEDEGEADVAQGSFVQRLAVQRHAGEEESIPGCCG